VKRSRALDVVCGHLRAGLLGARAPKPHPWLGWEQLIELSRSHYVAPALRVVPERRNASSHRRAQIFRRGLDAQRQAQ
jgi:hypothetical protein